MSTACDTCGFDLWLPIYTKSRYLSVGFYDDALFPGRCIVKVNDHYDRQEDLPASLSLRFIRLQQEVAKAIRVVTGCERVNVAVLGNTESHVHAHLIPRYAGEPNLTRTPWEHPQYSNRGKLPEHVSNFLRRKIEDVLMAPYERTPA